MQCNDATNLGKGEFKTIGDESNGVNAALLHSLTMTQQLMSSVAK